MNNILLLNRLTSSIKVSYKNDNQFCYVKSNKLVLGVLSYLRAEGSISGYKIENFLVKVYLKYSSTSPFILELKNYSTPAHKLNLTVFKLSKFIKKHPTCVILTKEGVMSGQKALIRNHGGIILFEIFTKC